MQLLLCRVSNTDVACLSFPSPLSQNKTGYTYCSLSFSPPSSYFQLDQTSPTTADCYCCPTGNCTLVYAPGFRVYEVSVAATRNPTQTPTNLPTTTPSANPTGLPSQQPSASPTTANPSLAPSLAPSSSPSKSPTLPLTGDCSTLANTIVVGGASVDVYQCDYNGDQGVSMCGTQTFRGTGDTFLNCQTTCITREDQGMFYRPSDKICLCFRDITGLKTEALLPTSFVFGATAEFPRCF